MNRLTANTLPKSLFALSSILILLFASVVQAEVKKTATEKAFVQAMLAKGSVKCLSPPPMDKTMHQQGMDSDRNGANAAMFFSTTNHIIKTGLDGKVLALASVKYHHGDLTYHDGKVYVAAEFGTMNKPGDVDDSWVYVYDAKDLSLVAKHPVPEVLYGIGGIAYHDGKFVAVGGLPHEVKENHLTVYDKDFKFIEHKVIPGHTFLGIQSAAYHNGYWWFGCYGKTNPIVLQVDESFNLVNIADIDFALGMVGLTEGEFLLGGWWASAKVRHITPSDLSKRKKVMKAKEAKAKTR
jgi:hypothetical protein